MPRKQANTNQAAADLANLREQAKQRILGLDQPAIERLMQRAPDTLEPVEVEMRRLIADARKAAVKAAQDAADAVRLSGEQETKADEYGKALGTFSNAKLASAEAMRDAAKFLLTLRGEVVGGLTPLQQAFLDRMTAQAKYVALGKADAAIKSDSTLANALSGLRKICRAASLTGHFPGEDGEPIRADAILTRLLDKSLSRDSTSGGFHPAVQKAAKIEAQAREHAAKDETFAKMLYGDSGQPKKQRGRAAQAPSADAFANIVQRVPLMDSAQAVALVKAAEERMLAILTNLQGATKDAKIRAELEATEAWVREHLQPVVEQGGKLLQAALMAVNHAPKAPPAEPTAERTTATGTVQPTHTDELTRKRGGKKATAKRAPKRAAGAVPSLGEMLQQAQA